MTDKESINEHIRNGLSPFVTLLDLVTCKLDFEEDEMRDKFMNSTIKSCKELLPRLLELGKDIFEDESVWKKK